MIDYQEIGKLFLKHCLVLLDAISQFINVAVFFSGNANESVSGRAWRNRNRSKFWGIMRSMIDAVAYPFEINHCENSHNADVKRAAQLLRAQGD